MEADKVDADVAMVVSVPWDQQVKAMTPKNRIKISGTSRILEIIAAVNVGERNNEFLLTCKERVANA